MLQVHLILGLFHTGELVWNNLGVNLNCSSHFFFFFYCVHACTGLAQVGHLMFWQQITVATMKACAHRCASVALCSSTLQPCHQRECKHTLARQKLRSWQKVLDCLHRPSACCQVEAEVLFLGRGGVSASKREKLCHHKGDLV